jgi:hypothetical protein
MQKRHLGHPAKRNSRSLAALGMTVFSSYFHQEEHRQECLCHDSGLFRVVAKGIILGFERESPP